MPLFTMGTLVPELPCHPTLPLRLHAAAVTAIAVADEAMSADRYDLLGGHARDGGARASFRPVIDEDGRCERVDVEFPGYDAWCPDLEQVISPLHRRSPFEEFELPSHLLLEWMAHKVSAFHEREGRPLAHVADDWLEGLRGWWRREPLWQSIDAVTISDHWLSAFAIDEALSRRRELPGELADAVVRSAPLRARLDEERRDAAAWAAGRPDVVEWAFRVVPGPDPKVDRLVLARRWDKTLLASSFPLAREGAYLLLEPG